MYFLEHYSYISVLNEDNEDHEDDPVSVMDLCMKENDYRILEKIEIFICIFVFVPVLFLSYIF